MVIGSRNRVCIWEDGELRILVIRRLRCTDCEKVHHELPDFLVPYKRHVSKTIESIVDGDPMSSAPCEGNTIQRIRGWFYEKEKYFCMCLNAVAAQLGEPPKPSADSLLHQIKDRIRPETKWLRRLVRIIVNSNYWEHTRSVFPPRFCHGKLIPT